MTRRFATVLSLSLIATGALFGQATNVFPSSGNVGIGTTSPQENLDVVGAARLNSSSIDTNLTINNAAPDAHVAVLSLSTASRRWALLSWNPANGGVLPGSFGLADGTTDYARMLVTADGTVFIGGNIDILDGSASGSAMSVDVNGNVGVGTTSPQYRLSVNGTIQAKEVLVNTGWSDYVFAPGYRLEPLNEVAAYIRTHRHLPGIPTEAEVKKNGVSVGEMESKLLAKVEELTLQLIQLDEKNKQLEARLAQLEARPKSEAKR